MTARKTQPMQAVTFTRSKKRAKLMTEGLSLRRGKGKTVTVMGRRKQSLVEISCSCFYDYGGGCTLKLSGRWVWCEKASTHACQGSCELMYRPVGPDTLIIWA